MRLRSFIFRNIIHNFNQLSGFLIFKKILIMSTKISQEKPFKDRDINIQTIKLLEKMESLIQDISQQLKQYQINLKTYIDETIEVSDLLNNRINNLKNFIKDQNDPNYIDIKEYREKMVNEIKDISKKYDKNIFIIHENNYLKNIQKNNQDFNDIVNDYLPDPNFQPPNINSFANDKTEPIINYEFSSDNDNNNSKSQSLIEGYKNYYNLKNPDESMNIRDKMNSFKISCKCTKCNKNEIINFCEECNQLFCESCFNLIKKCHDHKSIIFITDLKNELEIKRNLFINSFHHMLKSLLIKGNELLNSEYIKIGNSSSSFENLFNNSNKSNSISKIKYIKRIISNYPYIEQYDFSSN